MPESSIIIYQTEDGRSKIETRLQDETVWLTQAQLCELFQKSKATISEHIKNIFEEGELDEPAVVRDFRTTATEGKNYLNTDELNLLNRKPMYMKDWIERLDDFLRMTGNEILHHAGLVSHQQMLKKAKGEYEKFKVLTDSELGEAEKHFVEHLEKEIRKLPQPKGKK